MFLWCVNVAKKDGGATSSSDPDLETYRGREVKIARKFGEDVTPANWLAFKSHFKLTEKVNRAKGIRRRKDMQYQVMMLRLQLSSEPEAWLNQEEMAGESWMNDVRELMCRLETGMRHQEDWSKQFGGLRRVSSNRGNSFVRLWLD